MDITQVKNILTLTSPTSLVYSYIHIIQLVTTTETTIVGTNYTTSASTYEATDDGHYVITEIRADKTSNGDYYISNGILYTSGDVAVVDAEAILAIDYGSTNMTKTDYDHVSYYNLETYYIDLIQNKFLKGICSCGCAIEDNDKLVIDTLLMGLEVIKILISYDQYNEAQRLIENLSTCTGSTNANCNCYA